jgi:hypothetical protein
VAATFQVGGVGLYRYSFPRRGQAPLRGGFRVTGGRR